MPRARPSSLSLLTAAGLVLSTAQCRHRPPPPTAPVGEPGSVTTADPLWSANGAALAATLLYHYPDRPGADVAYQAGLFDTASGALRHRLDWPDDKPHIVFSDDAALVLVHGELNPNVGVYRVADGARVASLACGDARRSVWAAAFVGDRRVACQWYTKPDEDETDNGAFVWDLRTGARSLSDWSPASTPDERPLPAALKGVADGVAVAVSDSGAVAVVASRHTLTIWSTPLRAPLAERTFEVTQYGASVRPDDGSVAVAAGAGLAIVDLGATQRASFKDAVGAACLEGGCKDGISTQEITPQRRYLGMFRGGRRHGPGAIVDDKGEALERGYWENGVYAGDCAGDCLAGEGVVTFLDGRRYEGGFNGGVPDGVGSFSVGAKRYQGGWRDGRRDGTGVEQLENGERYEGDWRAGKRHGQGALRRPDGSRYVGAFVDGVRDGDGIETLASGEQYAGRFVADRRDGDGVVTDAKGAAVRARFRAGVLDGRCERGDCADGSGVWVDGNGVRSEGVFVAGRLHGLGRRVDASGHVDEGVFDHGVYVGRCARGDCHDGQGVFVFADGGHYEGAFVGGLRHGAGGQLEKSGRRVEGTWVRGSLEGKATVRGRDGSLYTGTVTRGLPHGQGVEVRADGSRYEGGWDTGSRSGAGVVRYADGSVFKGTFPEGEGTLRYPNGEVLRGRFRNGVAWGPGKLSRPGGGFGLGDWQDGVQLPPSTQAGEYPTVEAAWEAYGKRVDSVRPRSSTPLRSFTPSRTCDSKTESKCGGTCCASGEQCCAGDDDDSATFCRATSCGWGSHAVFSH